MVSVSIDCSYVTHRIRFSFESCYTATPFPANANAFRLAWERLRKRAGLCDLRFHDLRHEAISRFFEVGLSIPEVALISGHKDAKMLFRYTHLRAGNIIGKLG